MLYELTPHREARDDLVSADRTYAARDFAQAERELNAVVAKHAKSRQLAPFVT